VLLEVCVESVDDAKAAARGGAGRIELNAALTLDGLTPSIGLLAEVRRAVGARFPVIAMARPRAGDFVYSDSEFRVLLRDAALALEHGADGIAFGILTASGDVDMKRCRRVMGVTKTGASVVAVFHRAFDQVRDPFAALEQLIDLGVRRVMTSGHQPTALRGARLIAELLDHAAGRIEILPAGGIRPANARAIVDRTRCDQLHSSLRNPGTGRMDGKLLSELIDQVVGI
jgi:copper homeostasis protein